MSRLLGMLIAAVVLASPYEATAALTRIAGPTAILSESRLLVKFDTAFDTVNQVYLAVWGTQQAGPTNGQFLNTAGAPVGAPFAISDGPMQAGWARAIYSPEERKFLVSYTKILGPGTHQRVARFVTYQSPTSRIFSPEIVIDTWTGGAGTATGMTYSRGKFLVTWWNFNLNPPQTYVAVLDAAGNISAKVHISRAGDGQTDSEIACDPGRGRCLVIGHSWGVFSPTGDPGTWGQFINDQTGAKIGEQFIVYGRVQKEDSAVFSSAGDRFLVVFSRLQNEVWGMTVDANTLAVGAPYRLRRPLEDPEDGGGYGLPRLVYNPRTQSTLLAMVPWIARTAAMELDATGAQIPGTFQMTPVAGHWTQGTKEIAPAADAVNSRFVIADNQAFLTMRATAYQAVPSDAPPPPVSDVRLAIDSPAAGPVSGPLRIRGWAVDLGSTAGPGLDSIHIWANPLSGAPPIFLGVATYGVSRPDVGAALGNSRFNNSGFDLQALPVWPGTYDVVVHVRSVVTDQFSIAGTVRVTTGSFLTIDTPLGAATGTYFPLAGWAVDATAPTGTGVDTVHVWAFPNPGSGGPPFFIGAATYGLSRPDVSAALGNGRFTNSGYQILVWGLSPGVTYDLVAFAHSTATNQFNEVRVRRVTVTTHLTVDTPTSGVVSSSFVLEGWALDRAAPTGTGVDAVHVYAYRDPGSGTPPVFLGAATYGLARTDVATAFSSSRFVNSGFTLGVSGLAPGTYDLVVFTRSTVGGFNAARVIRVTVP